MEGGRHVPALLHRRLTPVYDLFARVFLREARLKRELVARACIGLGHRVLDLGAGTGTLAIMVKRAHPAAEVAGLDADPAIAVIACDKAARAGADIAFKVGDAAALPYPDGSSDRILSSPARPHSVLGFRTVVVREPGLKPLPSAAT
jgi:ubiquinone/menaquinone biosynthesis C-methylase UbiE